MKSFTTGEAVRITGVPFRNVDYWARTKLIVPSVAEATGTGSERRYNFGDLLRLRIARDLRAAGVTTRSIRPIIHFVRKVSSPEAAWGALVVNGADVHYVKSLAIPPRLLCPVSVSFVIDLGRLTVELQEIVNS